MAKIYRYEMNIKGKNLGPYIASNTFNDTPEFFVFLSEISDKHKNSDTHPGMRVDIPNYDESFNSYFCACPSLESLKQWFDGFNETIIELGFKLVEIEVKSIIEGISGKQCFFREDEIINKKVLVESN